LSTETNASGFYNLPRVPIGTYEIRVEFTGFQTAIHPPVQLELNQTARVDVVMQLGEVTQTIEVTGFSGEFAGSFEVDPRNQDDIRIIN